MSSTSVRSMGLRQVVAGVAAGLLQLAHDIAQRRLAHAQLLRQRGKAPLLHAGGQRRQGLPERMSSRR